MILSLLDLNFFPKFFWAFTAPAAIAARRINAAAGCAGDIASACPDGSHERATCIGCNGAPDVLYGARYAAEQKAPSPGLRPPSPWRSSPR